MTRIFMLFLSITFFVLSVVEAASTAPSQSNDPFYSSVPAAYMDDPRRNEWQQPDQVIDYLFIKPGDTIADIGAGTGYFTTRFARKVGKAGLVFSADVDEAMVRFIEKRAKKEGLGNIRAIHAHLDDPLIPRSSADVIFICDTYLFIDNRVQYLSRLRDSLKTGGRLAIISFNASAEIPGAPPQQRMISKSIVIQEAIAAGYAPEADYLFLPFQDFLVFRKR